MNSRFLAQMERILWLYSLPYDPLYPVLCYDERPCFLIGDRGEPLALQTDQLCHLMDGLEQPGIDDFDLYDTGAHRTLYDYLTREMGLTVQPGRGPAWHRAKALIEKYEG